MLLFELNGCSCCTLAALLFPLICCGGGWFCGGGIISCSNTEDGGGGKTAVDDDFIEWLRLADWLGPPTLTGRELLFDPGFELLLESCSKVAFTLFGSIYL